MPIVNRFTTLELFLEEVQRCPPNVQGFREIRTAVQSVYMNTGTAWRVTASYLSVYRHGTGQPYDIPVLTKYSQEVPDSSRVDQPPKQERAFDLYNRLNDRLKELGQIPVTGDLSLSDSFGPRGL